MMRRLDNIPMEREIINRLDDFASSLTPQEAAGGFYLEDIFVRAGITSNSQQAAFNHWSGMVKDYLRQCGWKRRMLMWYPPVIVSPAHPALPDPEPHQELPESVRSEPPALRPAQKKMSYRELLAAREWAKQSMPQLPPGNDGDPQQLQ